MRSISAPSAPGRRAGVQIACARSITRPRASCVAVCGLCVGTRRGERGRAACEHRRAEVRSSSTRGVQTSHTVCFDRAQCHTPSDSGSCAFTCALDADNAEALTRIHARYRHEHRAHTCREPIELTILFGCPLAMLHTVTHIGIRSCSDPPRRRRIEGLARRVWSDRARLDAPRGQLAVVFTPHWPIHAKLSHICTPSWTSGGWRRHDLVEAWLSNAEDRADDPSSRSHHCPRRRHQVRS